jgi:hypothetical protein
MTYQRPGVPRRFWLVERHTSHTATIVAEGTQSSQGRVVIFSPDSSVPAAIWPDMKALLDSQPGTAVHWLDQDRLMLKSIP